MNNYNNNYRKEIDEAINAADNALYHLHRADDLLKSASNWGIVDLFGGGLISTFAKHSKMDDAKHELELAKNAVRGFQRELMDVNQVIDLDIDTGDFLSFADFFFDGFVADLLMQSRIKTTKQQIADAIAKINGIKLSLQQYR